MFRRLTPTQWVADAAIAAAFVVFGLLLVYLRGMPTAIVLLAMAATLVLRRASPGLALGIAWVTALAQVAAGLGPDPSNVAIFAVIFSTAAYGTRLVRWLGFASSFAGAAVIGVWFAAQIAFLDSRVWVVLSSAFAGSLALFLLAWALGQLWRIWLRFLESRRTAADAQVSLAAEEERGRIARDMHDVVAHSLSVVVAQADGARYSKDPATMETALATISTTSREALADVRTLLAQLRHREPAGPQPVLADLDRLYAQVRDAGLRLVVESTGEPQPLATGRQLAVYRIVQESLTNALRHGDPAQDVVVRQVWTPHGLDVTISNALGGSAPAPGGHGLAGMSERAALAGGQLEAGADRGRYSVHAWIPAAETS